MYYQDKIETLQEIFGTKDIYLKNKSIIIDKKEYDVKNDVIVINSITEDRTKSKTVKSFGNEWFEFNQITPEHYNEFKLYFDLIDISKLRNKRIIDLGCGIGRWSKILIDKVDIKNLTLVDLSDSIFVAREFFRENNNVIFIQDDLEKLNFKNNSFDFLVCLGVLHHLKNKEKIVLEKIKNISEEYLIYLYYKLDDTYFYYKIFFYFANLIRKLLSKSNYFKINVVISYFLTIIFYYPFIILSKIFNLFNFNTLNFPLSFYNTSSFFRVRQDAYDRFFTNIEHRYSKSEIKSIYGKYFRKITISNQKPYWHFLCKK